MAKKVLLVDFSWLFNRSLYAFKELTQEIEGKVYPTGGIYGVLKFVESSMGWQFDEKIMCLDGYPKFRKELYPEYKGNRDHGDEFRTAARLLNPDLLKILSAVGFKIVKNNDYEADDIMASEALKTVKEGGTAMLYTSDKDMFQLIPYGVMIANKIENNGLIQITPDDVSEKVGVAPSLCRHFLPLKGDTSDNVPNAAPRVLSKFLVPFAEIIREQTTLGKSLEEAYDIAYAEISPKMSEKARQAMNKSQYLTNFALMDFTQYWYNPIKLGEPINENKSTGDILATLDKLGMKDFKAFYFDMMAVYGW